MNGAEAVWPAAIVTIVTTVASPVSSLLRVTVNAEVISVFRLIVAVVVPPFSLIEAAAIATVKRATSSSATSTTSVPLACPTADTVTVTV